MWKSYEWMKILYTTYHFDRSLSLRVETSLSVFLKYIPSMNLDDTIDI